MSLGGVLFLTPKAGAIEEKASVFKYICNFKLKASLKEKAQMRKSICHVTDKGCISII